MGTSSGIVTGLESLGAETRAVLATAEDASEMFERIYRARKAADRKVSLQYLCRRAGIPSTGYLSDVLKGRRRLHPKYARTLPAALGVSGIGARILRARLELDHERDPLRARRLRRRLAKLRKTLEIEGGPMPRALAGMLFAFEVFAAFGLFANRPTHADLLGYFGATREREVERALRILEAAGMVAPDGKAYRLLKSHFLFTDVDGDLSQLAYTQQALDDARRRAPRWFAQRDLSLFQATTISVNRRRYQALLPKIREMFLEAQSALERTDADLLVRLNVQAYPVQ